MKIDNMPSRPLYLYEVRLINENSDVNHAEALFYASNNINAAICVFLNINEKGYIIGYNKNESEWVKLTELNEKEGVNDNYMDETDNIVGWFIDLYGEDGYNIYNMFGKENYDIQT